MVERQVGEPDGVGGVGGEEPVQVDGIGRQVAGRAARWAAGRVLGYDDHPAQRRQPGHHLGQATGHVVATAGIPVAVGGE